MVKLRSTDKSKMARWIPFQSYYWFTTPVMSRHCVQFLSKGTCSMTSVIRKNCASSKDAILY